MHSELIIGSTFVCIYAGFAWLALAMSVHWVQVTGFPSLKPSAAVTFRVLGTVALLVSLGFSLAAVTAGIAVLVWIMSLAAGAAAVAFTLTWYPRSLRLLTLSRK